jgi:Glycosyl transferase family 2
VKLVMTILARNEADIVDAQIAFHLRAGVDFVIATDNRSDDGTTEILERYERAGRLRLIREPGDDMRQAEWVTRMARLAATDLGADWVINSDADEFWWPREGSLKDVLAAIPERFGLVRGCWRHFLPRPDNGASFAERMTVRLAAPAHPGDKATIYHAHQKVAHRAHPAVWIERGNHNAIAPGLEPLRGWHPIEVLHFSFRSARQTERKVGGGWLRNAEYEAPQHRLAVSDAHGAGRVDDYFSSLVVDDDALARGLADGTLEVDTRLRDALRHLATGDPSALPFRHPAVAEDAMYAAEASILQEIDAVVRAEARVRGIEERLDSLERTRLRRVAGDVSRWLRESRRSAAVD